MRALISILTLLAWAILADAGELPQSMSDTEIRQKMIGTWIADVETTDRTYWANIRLIYSSNGCYVSKLVVFDQGKTHQEKYEGMWFIKDGNLMDTVTNAAGIPGGDVPRHFEIGKVTRLDDSKLIVEISNKSNTNQSVYTRSK